MTVSKLLIPLLAVEAAVVGAVDWSSTITLGSIIVGLLVGVAGLAVFGWGVKYKTGMDAAEANAKVFAEGREAYRLRSDRLAEELKDCRAQIAEMTDQLVAAKSELVRLEERPDLPRVLELMGEQAVRQDTAADLRVEKAIERLGGLFAESLRHHDEAARERQEEIIRLLSEAQR